MPWRSGHAPLVECGNNLPGEISAGMRRRPEEMPSLERRQKCMIRAEPEWRAGGTGHSGRGPYRRLTGESSGLYRPWPAATHSCVSVGTGKRGASHRPTAYSLVKDLLCVWEPQSLKCMRRDVPANPKSKCLIKSCALQSTSLKSLE